MPPIRFGFILPAGPRGDGARATFLADARRALDLIGGRFDSAWVADHFQSDNQDMHECWTTLTYLAALHPRAERRTLRAAGPGLSAESGAGEASYGGYT